jgi:hypothetical protein
MTRRLLKVRGLPRSCLNEPDCDQPARSDWQETARPRNVVNCAPIHQGALTGFADHRLTVLLVGDQSTDYQR